MWFSWVFIGVMVAISVYDLAQRRALFSATSPLSVLWHPPNIPHRSPIFGKSRTSFWIPSGPNYAGALSPAMMKNNPSTATSDVESMRPR